MARILAKALVVLLCCAPPLEAQAIRNVPRISIDELKVLMDQQAVLILDVRDADSFAKGRIPGAVNVDYTLILKQADRFAGDKRTIVAYCACANEMTAARASVDLAAKGIPGAKALRGGWDEWVQRGEKIEK
ncbi:MAG TPA: rhodanese-like domain-containing protein [Vicinamibacterales bacterium]|nr:rhodanese-like domain-containing protein [Vicinamibacterales bacterium]